MIAVIAAFRRSAQAFPSSAFARPGTAPGAFDPPLRDDELSPRQGSKFVIEAESKSMLGRATVSYVRLEVIALLAALSIASSAPAQVVRNPRQTTWQGSLTTTTGLTGTFIARTHLASGRDLTPTFEGRFRCLGSGCPMRHGSIALYADFGGPRRIFQIAFGVVRGAIYCSYVNDQAPPNFGVDGEYSCYPRYPRGPDVPLPAPVLSSGTLNLEPRGVPKRRPLFD